MRGLVKATYAATVRRHGARPVRAAAGESSVVTMICPCRSAKRGRDSDPKQSTGAHTATRVTPRLRWSIETRPHADEEVCRDRCRHQHPHDTRDPQACANASTSGARAEGQEGRVE